jgi:hypothetical protein
MGKRRAINSLEAALGSTLRPGCSPLNKSTGLAAGFATGADGFEV